MPDLVTHVSIIHLIKRPFEIRSKDRSAPSLRALLYLGTILPDILTRPWYILFPDTHDWTFPFHTPFGMILCSGLIALFFETNLRKKAFVNLITGAGLHFFLDAFQQYITNSVFWLFPFSWISFGLGLLWADIIIGFVPIWVALVVAFEGGVWLWKKKRIHYEF